MSRARLETIQCPKCGERREVTLWDSVNVTLNPELKKSVLDGSLTRYWCPGCGNTATIAHDFLYHDMAKRLLVWLKYPDEEGFFGIDPISASTGDVFGEGYVCRVVPTYEELVEKVLIADANLDDVEVELIELLVCIRERIDITAPFVFGGLRTSLLRGTSIVFNRVQNDTATEMLYTLKGVKAAIDRIPTKLKDLPRDDDAWPYVNREYLANRLSEAGLLKWLE